MPNWLHSVLADAAGIKGREVIPRLIPVASPAAGAEWTVPVQSSTVWLVQAVNARLVTSATVANRSPRLQISDGSSTIVLAGASAVEAASGSVLHVWARGLAGFNNSTSGGVLPQSLPAIPLLGGWSLGTLTSSIDAGDQWSGIFLYVLEIEQTPYDVEVQRDLAQLAGSRVDAVPQLGSEY